MHGGNQMEILKAMEHAPLPLDEVIYEPSIEELEGLKIADEMKERAYGLSLIHISEPTRRS